MAPTLKGFDNFVVERLIQRFQRRDGYKLSSRVIPWAKLCNAFGVRNSGFDTDSVAGGSLLAITDFIGRRVMADYQKKCATTRIP